VIAGIVRRMVEVFPSTEPAAEQAPSRRSRTRMGLVLAYACAVLLGVLVGVVGTVVHRQWAPWILLVALLTVAVAGVMVRAWVSTLGLVPYGIGWLVAVQVLATTGPGGDVLMPAQAVSYAWMIAGMVMIAVAAFAPHRWFRD
jgi:Family of unknown function (DUF6113)